MSAPTSSVLKPVAVPVATGTKGASGARFGEGAFTSTGAARALQRPREWLMKAPLSRLGMGSETQRHELLTASHPHEGEVLVGATGLVGGSDWCPGHG